MKIAFIGYGNVGRPLALSLQSLGHQVTLASSRPDTDTVQKVLSKNPGIGVARPVDAAAESDIVFLATPFQANQEALLPARDALSGKILVDCTNPVGAGITHALDSNMSGSQSVQAFVPDARVVKAFTIYGYENLENNRYPDYNMKPVMLYCGNDGEAKSIVSSLIEQLGWHPFDVGGLDQALHLEHMTLLWIRMVRANGHGPGLVWAVMERP